MDDEIWREVEEFPRYAVSNYGNVLSRIRDLLIVQTLNQQGIPYVRFSHDDMQSIRSVAVLVAKTFLAPPPADHFNAPINIDGVRTNNHVDNLAWRPRWFAVKYHKQFKIELDYDAEQPIIEIHSGVVYAHTWEAAKALGLLEKDVFLSIQNNTLAFPMHHGYQFELFLGD